MPVFTFPTLEEMRSLEAEWFEATGSLYRLLWTIVDPELLELCRLRYAQLLGCPADSGWRSKAAQGIAPEKLAALADWRSSAVFTERERDALAYAESYLRDVKNVTDEEAWRVSSTMTGEQFYAFTLALGMFESWQKLLLSQRIADPAQASPETYLGLPSERAA